MASDHRNTELLDFLERLRKALEIRGVSQAELARRLGVRHATVNEWFTRNRAPNGLIMLRLPDVLDVDASWLFTGAGEPDGPAADMLKDVSGRPAQAIAEIRRILRVLERKVGQSPSSS